MLPRLLLTTLCVLGRVALDDGSDRLYVDPYGDECGERSALRQEWRGGLVNP